ncbi:MAG: FAD-dependent monooxygenase, partial [Chthoniobacterales bacterium]
MTQEPRVLVIGAGPCGLLSALLLARFGVPCMIVDGKDGPSIHPRAMGITRRTAELYRQLGLLEQMREMDIQEEGLALSICMRSLAGEEFGRTAMGELNSEYTPCRAFHCPQPHTEKVLLEALEKEPLARVCYGTRVTNLTEVPGDGVRAHLETGGKKSTLRVPWVIAADGAGGGTRHQLGIESAGSGDMGQFLNIYFVADYASRLTNSRAVLYHCVSTDYAEFFVSVNGGSQWLMHHFLMPGETQEDYPDEKLVEIIRRASGFEDIKPRIISVNKWVMSPKVSQGFRHGRIFLTGDAAARLSPSGGLGMNTGLQAAHNLAWKLAAVIQGTAEEALLDTYETERRPLALQRMHATNKNSIEVF